MFIVAILALCFPAKIPRCKKLLEYKFNLLGKELLPRKIFSLISKKLLEEALHLVMNLLLLPVVTPLTRVHFDQVFCRIKGLASPGRSNPTAKKKTTSFFLQMEIRLRYLTAESLLKENVVKI